MTLEIITDDLLTEVPHGFFTRKGGASAGVYQGLNCGFGSSDQHEIVAINRARVADAMGVAPDHMMAVYQVHSADVATITQATPDKPKADALVTNVPGLALSILTADCQPVLFADPQARVVGAAHAGSAYEVGPEFLATFIAEDPLYARFFAQGTGDKVQFDLPAFGLMRLRSAGIKEAAWTRHCTYADESRFYSYRRTTHRKEADYGRLIAAITCPT